MADIKVSQLNDGVVDSSSYLLESNTGVSYKVKASDIGTFVNEAQADYSLNTTANTIVGAINEVNDKFGSIFYSYAGSSSNSFTVAADSSLDLTATDIGYSIPTGYTPVGFTRLFPSNDNIAIAGFDVNATGTNSFITLRNVTSSSQTLSGFEYTVLMFAT